jgi:hypothetical protein
MKINHKPAEIYTKPDWWVDITDSNHVITINWNSQNNQWWNEKCASVLEVFGLPGDRFYYKPYPTHMTFTFKSLKDAKLCQILLSESL